MKTVYILGRGPSLRALEKANIPSDSDVILMNDHSNTLKNPQMAEKLNNTNNYVMCNSEQKGFNPTVFNKLEIKGCLTNRLKPNWDLWQVHKDKQRKHFEGGTPNNLGYLPYLSEDEPYLYFWRGPRDRNLEDMRTYDGRKIEHIPEEAEQYLIQIYEDKLIGNCSYYATLYAILKLNADHIIYYGLDFYNNLGFKKPWYINPPTYGTAEWWTERVAYEGEHMKVVYDDYLAKFFPDITFEFNTTAALDLRSKNIVCNNISFGPQEASSTYY